MGVALSIERVTATLASSSSSVSVNLTETGSGDYDNAVPFYTAIGDDTSDLASNFVRGYFQASPNRVTFDRGADETHDGGAVTIECYVVRFNDDIEVTQGTATIGHSNTIENVTITAVDLDKTFVYFGWEHDDGQVQTAFPRGWFTSTTNLRFERDNGFSASTTEVSYYILEDVSVGGAWDVQAWSASFTGGSDTQVDATITAVVTADTLCVASCMSAVSPGDVPARQPNSHLLNTTTVRSERGNSTSDAEVQGFVVEFSDDTSIQRGLATIAADTASIDVTVTTPTNAHIHHTPCRTGWTDSNDTLTGRDARSTALRERVSDTSTRCEIGANDAWTTYESSWEVWDLEAASSGFSLTADAGAFTETGTAADLEAGRLVEADAGAFTETGTAADLEYGRRLDAEAGAFTETGTEAGLERGAAVDAESGAFTEAGTDAGLLASRLLDAESGSLTETGTDAGLNRGYAVDAESGTFTEAGTDAGLVHDRLLDAEAGAFTETGTEAGLEAGYRLDAEAGAFTHTGTDAGLVYDGADPTLAAETGVFNETGTAADLRRDGLVDADPGAFTEAGTDAGLLHDRALSADAGAYALAGTDADLRLGQTLDAETGAYSASGTDAGLDRSYRLDAESGAFAHTGTDADLFASGDPRLTADPGAFALAGADADLVLVRVTVARPPGGNLIRVDSVNRVRAYSGPLVIRADALRRLRGYGTTEPDVAPAAGLRYAGSFLRYDGAFLAYTP